MSDPPPPPPPPSPGWYFRRAGRQAGPLTREELDALCAASLLSPNDEVSSDGATWTSAAEVSGLPFARRMALDYDVPRERPTVMTGYACDMLAQTSIYVRIMSVLMFIGAALLVILPFMAAVSATAGGGGEAAAGVCVSIAVAVIYVIPATLLAQYASSSRQFGKLRETRALERALRAQKSFWQFTAILAVIVVCLYTALIAFGVLMASMGGRL